MDSTPPMTPAVLSRRAIDEISVTRTILVDAPPVAGVRAGEDEIFPLALSGLEGLLAGSRCWHRSADRILPWRCRRMVGIDHHREDAGGHHGVRHLVGAAHPVMSMAGALVNWLGMLALATPLSPDSRRRNGHEQRRIGSGSTSGANVTVNELSAVLIVPRVLVEEEVGCVPPSQDVHLAAPCLAVSPPRTVARRSARSPFRQSSSSGDDRSGSPSSAGHTLIADFIKQTAAQPVRSTPRLQTYGVTGAMDKCPTGIPRRWLGGRIFSPR